MIWQVEAWERVTAPEVIVALVGGLVALIVAWIKHHEVVLVQQRMLSEVHASTVNSHGTDLRADVDDVLAVARLTAGEVNRVRDALAELAGTVDALAQSVHDHQRDSKAWTGALEESLEAHGIDSPEWPAPRKEPPRE